MRISLHRAAVLLLVLSAWSIALASSAQAQQETSQVPPQQVLRTVVFKGDMALLLNAMAEAYNVNLGFEADPLRPGPQIDFQVNDANFREVLDDIVRVKTE